MDKEQKNTDTVKPDIQHQEQAPRTPVVERPTTQPTHQESDLKKVLKPEVLDL